MLKAARSKVLKILTYEEGFKATAYWCTEGFPTIGYGTKLSHSTWVPLENYDALELTKTTAAYLLEAYVDKIAAQLHKFNWFHGLNADRQAIIVSMAYQMGVDGLLGFTNTIRAIEMHDWNTAAAEMLDSLWAKKQTANRANRHSEVMRTGSLSSSYKDK